MLRHDAIDVSLSNLSEFPIQSESLIALGTMNRAAEEEDDDGGRLFIVANRLPISISQREDGEFEFKLSSGGLVSGLKSLSAAMKFRWFGWPGIDVHRNDKDQLQDKLKREFDAIPVFLPRHLAEKHYNGFSNAVLWPLLHRMPEKAQTDTSWSEAYQEVNEIFADNLIPQLEDGDMVWIHDYHLLLLAGALRKRLRGKKVRLGFFLHTPFPSEDYFSILPFREAICDGLLSCDVVGFHIREYVEDFLDSAQKVLPGVERSPSDLHYGGRKLVVHEFPIGIEASEFHQKLASDNAQEKLRRLETDFRDKKVLLGVDRLDYIKGIPQKILAFDKFLTDSPQWLGKVVLIQLAIPTRADVDEYRKQRLEVERLVGFVNGKHGSFSYTPIIYLYRSIDPETLCALYAVADSCIVSSTRDGLNLVSYEYVACQRSRNGVLMMSQYTGAAQMLTSCFKFNPWDTPRFAEAIGQVLAMPIEERRRRWEEAADVVESWNSIRWGKSFVKTLQTMEVPDKVPHSA